MTKNQEIDKMPLRRSIDATDETSSKATRKHISLEGNIYFVFDNAIINDDGYLLILCVAVNMNPNMDLFSLLYSHTETNRYAAHLLCVRFFLFRFVFMLSLMISQNSWFIGIWFNFSSWCLFLWYCNGFTFFWDHFNSIFWILYSMDLWCFDSIPFLLHF